MKQKRKLKTGNRFSNKRFLVVIIGLLVILTLAVANLAFMVNYRVSGDGQTATAIVATNDQLRHYMIMTETQAAMPTSTGEAP